MIATQNNTENVYYEPQPTNLNNLSVIRVPKSVTLQKESPSETASASISEIALSSFLNKNVTATANIYNHKDTVQNSLKVTNPVLNIIKVSYSKADDGSKIINVSADPTKKEVIVNSDGTTSFNYSHIGTTWH